MGHLGRQALSVSPSDGPRTHSHTCRQSSFHFWPTEKVWLLWRQLWLALAGAVAAVVVVDVVVVVVAVVVVAELDAAGVSLELFDQGRD